MPYLKIQTNVALNQPDREALAGEASQLVSGILGKPEDYVMVAVTDGVTMSFAAGGGPCAYIELHSIGLTREQAGESVAALCETVGRSLGVAGDRIYVNCQAAERTMWGWNGATFG
jgi:phenylpyruvate tautomerase PptA (4-oxalocrotonate tautomerase family)